MNFARKAKWILCALTVLVGFAFGSCTGEGREAPVPLAAAAAIPEASFPVRFLALGEEIAREEVKAGALPRVPDVEDVTGARFGGWVDASGRRAEPGVTPVEGECEYTAVFLPLLDGEGPYLFTGSGGLLRPDETLKTTELAAALNALAGEDALDFFPESFPSRDDVTADELRAVLSYFFTFDEMDRVILGYDSADKISRANFAVIMNRLLGREGDEPVVPDRDVYRIPDVPLSRSDYTALMEAGVEHRHGAAGKPWRNISLPAIYDEGYVLVEGGLYLADSEGFFVTDTVLGSLTFGYDGRYTSGDSVLDSYVRAVIADIAETRPEAEPMELLEAAYDYCCGSFGFTRRNIYELGAQGWATGEAVTMFETKCGNCCGYAAAFWALARGLGFEAVAVNGTIGEDRIPHAWVEMELDGETYICDPAMEAGAVEGVEPGRDMFMRSPSQLAGWGYFSGGEL